MDSKELLKKLMSGSNGITRDGHRAIYIGGEFYNSEDELPYAFLIVESKIENSEIKWYSEDLKYSSQSPSQESLNDIVGLWEEKPEPFDLERALAGEPVKTRDGCKAYVQIKIEQHNELTNYTLIGYGFNGNHREFLHWNENGMLLSDDISCDDIIGMWKEPEPISSADDLPKPIREFVGLEEFWFIGVSDMGYTPIKTIKIGDWRTYQHSRLEGGVYYATEEDCQKVCNWLMNR